jgi:antirestriction protein ArdC
MKTATAAPARPTMTAADAKKFEHYSEDNAQALEDALTCNCEPYIDIFTLRRWNAQGYKVKKGEKSQVIKTYRTIQKKDPKTKQVMTDENGKPVTFKVPKKSYVFCRCQVEPFEKESSKQ